MNKPFVSVSSTGCLLPALIIANLFFGLLFLKPFLWLAVGGVLLGLFIVQLAMLSRRITLVDKKRRNVIDVQGEVIRESARGGEELPQFKKSVDKSGGAQ